MPEIKINPYEGVDWDAVEQKRVNLHTHTTDSDGDWDPEDVVDLYADAGYYGLAITEHETDGSPSPVDPYPNWPWSEFDRDPGEMGIVAIKGNESDGGGEGHHVLSLFNGVGVTDDDPETADRVVKIRDNGGLAIIAHPYSKDCCGDTHLFDDATGTLFDTLQEFDDDDIPPIEIYNQGKRDLFEQDRDPTSKDMWFDVMDYYAPDHILIGYANDDAHEYDDPTDFENSWNTLLIEDPPDPSDDQEGARQAIRDALEEGRFYISNDHNAESAGAPIINSIDVDEVQKTITVDAEDHDGIHWLTSGREEIATGSKLEYGEHESLSNSFVIPVLEGSETATQPFTFEGDGPVAEIGDAQLGDVTF